MQVACAAGYSPDIRWDSRSVFQEDLECKKRGMFSRQSLMCYRNCKGSPAYEDKYSGLQVVAPRKGVISALPMTYQHGVSFIYTCRAPFVSESKDLDSSTVTCSNGRWSRLEITCVGK
jgi:hypothetical protein